MQKPLVSVIMSSFNHSKYIEAALKSIFEQSYLNIEIILCDNCSADNTYEVALNYCNNNNPNNINCIIEKNDENLGVTKSLNKCLEYAKGKFFFNLWTDDVMDIDCINSFVGHALENPDFHGLYICETSTCDIKGQVLSSKDLFFLGDGGVVDKNIFWHAMLTTGKNELGVLPYFGAIQDLIDIGKFGSKYNAVEWDLYIRFNGGPGVYYVPEKLYFFRQVPASAGKNPSSYADGLLGAVIENAKFFGENYTHYLYLTKLRIIRIFISNFFIYEGFRRLFTYLKIEKNKRYIFYFIFFTIFCLVKFSTKRLILKYFESFYIRYILN